MSQEFEARVALVTGGSRGIGRAIALQLAEGGADVAITYANRPGPAEETVAAIQKLGRRGRRQTWTRQTQAKTLLCDHLAEEAEAGRLGQEQTPPRHCSGAWPTPQWRC